MNLQLLTNSRITCFYTCPRLHRNKYELRRRPRRKAEALTLGTLVHAGLEAWWLAIMAGLGAEAALDAMMNGATAALADVEVDDFNEYMWVKVQAMLIGYHMRWYQWVVDNSIEVLGVEQEFAAPLINPMTGRPSRTWLLAGKLDLMIAMLGRQLIGEHKTTVAELDDGAPYWERLRMDGQISLYHDGATSLGYEPAGCLYDVLRKPGQKPKLATPEASRRYTKGKGCKECGGSAGGKKGVVKGRGFLSAHNLTCSDCDGTGWKEAPHLDSRQRIIDETAAEYRERIADAITAAPESWYAHAEIVRLDSEMSAHRRDVWHAGKAIRAAQVADVWPRNSGACQRFNRFCEYYGACCGVDDLDDDSLFCDSEAHPELSIPKEEGANASTERPVGEDV